MPDVVRKIDELMPIARRIVIALYNRRALSRDDVAEVLGRTRLSPYDYSQIRKLIEAGLITKEDECYQLTAHVRYELTRAAKMR